MKNMIKITLAAVLTALLFSCVTGKGREDFSEYRMTSFSLFDGNEKLIQNLTISYGENNKPTAIIMTGPDGEEVGRRLVTYNKTGDITALENSGVMRAYTLSEYNYDKYGYLIEVTTRSEDGKMVNKTTYINDDDGNPVEWTSSTGRTSEDVHFKVEYDEQGKVIQTSELDPTGKVIYYSRSEYDEEGNELSYAIYSPEGEVDQKMVNNYREGLLKQIDIVDGNNNTLYSTVYEYNENNKPVLISNYNQYGDRSDYSEISYNSEGLERENRFYNYEGKLQETTEKHYDEWGNLIEITISGPDGEAQSITRNTYENRPLFMTEKEFNSLVFQIR
jgi:hypothetical protein